VFSDRRDAGRRLARLLRDYADEKPVVLALPRGGVPVAAPVAIAFGAPLDVVVVRKLGVPGQPELAMGAVVEAGRPVTIRNEAIIRVAHVSEAEFDEVRASELAEAQRRRELYVGRGRRLSLKGRAVIVIDDGIATGASMRAAVKAVRKQQPARLVVAVPVAARTSLEALRGEVDDIVCVDVRDDLRAIGVYYDDFEQVSDDEVIATLRSVNATHP
jgi:predicted phosphoribosyltransferase